MESYSASDQFRQKLLNARNGVDISKLAPRVNWKDKLKEKRDWSLSSYWAMSREETEKLCVNALDDSTVKSFNSLEQRCTYFLTQLVASLRDVRYVTLATALVFWQRFFLRQSSLENDAFIIATACVFLAGKVEENKIALKDLINNSSARFPVALGKRKREETYEEQMEHVLVGAHLVLITLRFDLDCNCKPYQAVERSIIGTIMKDAGTMHKRVFESFIAGLDQCRELGELARYLACTGLYKSLCLKYKPVHTARGAILVAVASLEANMAERNAHHIPREYPCIEEFLVTTLKRTMDNVCKEILASECALVAFDSDHLRKIRTYIRCQLSGKFDTKVGLDRESM